MRPRTPSTTPRRRCALRVDGRQRSKIFDYLSMASACFIADDPEQADRYARLALVSMGSNSSHRTWDRLREMYRLTAEYAELPEDQGAARGDQAGAAEAEPSTGRGAARRARRRHEYAGRGRAGRP